MKLASFWVAGHEGFGAVVEGGIVELTGRLSGRQQTLREALDAEALAEATKIVADADPDHALDDIEWRLPIPDSEKICCVGQNYAAHITEMGMEMPTAPSIFARFPRTFVPHRGQMIMPSHSVQFDYEGEMAAVIGREARRVSVEDALDYVAGYTICNDGSVRDWQRAGPQVAPGKNWEASGALGPWIATADDAGDPADMNLTTRVNGEVRQRGNTSDLVFSAAYLISYISTYITLMPGDIISTGSPSGVAAGFDPPKWLIPGDTLEFEIGGIGILSAEVIGAD